MRVLSFIIGALMFVVGVLAFVLSVSFAYSLEDESTSLNAFCAQEGDAGLRCTGESGSADLGDFGWLVVYGAGGVAGVVGGSVLIGAGAIAGRRQDRRTPQPAPAFAGGPGQGPGPGHQPPG